MSKYLHKFKKANLAKIKQLKTKDPRAYWKILNGSKKQNIQASLNDLYEHFKRVNYDDSAEEFNEPELILPDTVNDNHILNSEISLEEIANSVKS